MIMECKNYEGLKELKTFEERFEYLNFGSPIGIDTFGAERYLNQNFYRSKDWKRIRDLVIIRDDGNDLGMEGYPIGRPIIVHHIIPITVEDLEESKDIVFDMNNLISCSRDTHNAIHYGSSLYLETKKENERAPNDTCPWKN